MNPQLLSISTALFSWLLALSVQLVILTLLVAAVCRWVPGIPAAMRHVLWLVVLAKVLLPPSLTAPWAAGAWAAPAVLHGFEALLLPFEDPIRAMHGAGAVDGDIGLRATRVVGAWLGLARDGVDGVLLLVVGGYLVGVALCALSMVGQTMLTGELLRDGRRVREGDLWELMADTAAELGMGAARLPRLYLSSEVSSPFVCGLWRPCIVIPAHLPEALAPAQMRLVLAHELLHIRRGDLLFTWLQVLAQVVLWFHPLVWLAGARLDLERELAVDGEVLAMERGRPVAYARTILATAEAAVAGLATAPAGAAGFLGGQGEAAQLRRRIEVLFHPEPRLPAMALHAGALAFALVALPMAPPDAPTARDQSVNSEVQTTGRS